MCLKVFYNKDCMKNIARPIGIHIRLHNSLLDILPIVEQLKIEVAQSFLIAESNKYVSLNDKIVKEFIKIKRKQNFLYYVHAAYWSGLTDSRSKMFASLQREVEYAQRLQSDGIVIHSGSTRNCSGFKRDHVSSVIESINKLNDTYPNIRLLLENTPHAGKSFGGNLEDFSLIMERVEKKELVGFCVDTAHAFVYGYDIFHEKGRADFIKLIDDILGRQNIKLLHLNDSQDRCGSYIDKHEIPGDGLIGCKALANIMNDVVFKDVPIIVEKPGSCLKKDEDIIHLIRSLQD